MSKIYEQHDAAFANVSAFVVLKDGDRVATIAFKHPRDGAGRLYAYVHWLGCPMVRGFASGGGYDKKTAACAAAIRRFRPDHPNLSDVNGVIAERVSCQAFVQALSADKGPTWDKQLRDAGFTVLQAV